MVSHSLPMRESRRRANSAAEGGNTFDSAHRLPRTKGECFRAGCVLMPALWNKRRHRRGGEPLGEGNWKSVDVATSQSKGCAGGVPAMVGCAKSQRLSCRLVIARYVWPPDDPWIVRPL